MNSNALDPLYGVCLISLFINKWWHFPILTIFKIVLNVFEIILNGIISKVGHISYAYRVEEEADESIRQKGT